MKSKPVTNGWLNQLIFSLTGGDKLAILEFAAIAVVVIAIIGALCTYAEKLLTTSVGQWVMHDLRQALYVHIQRMSLAYHDHNHTGDLISRVTSDIDAIQTFISSNLLDAVIDVLTLGGHDRRDVLHQLAVHADRTVRRACAGRRGVQIHAAISRKHRGRCVRKRARSFP